jgi:hypothetical protein
MYNIDRDLVEIDHVIQTKTQKDREMLYEKYISMYNITKTFLKEKGLLLYGGLALNLSLPKDKRFYDQYELPDYDFLSYSAVAHAKELADRYHEQGYEYVEVRPGIHYATFKVYVDFMPVADITDIPLRLFEYFSEISREEKPLLLANNPNLDINIVPLAFIRLEFHKELSRPEGYIERWPKVYKRMTIFYNTYPLHFQKCDEVYTDEDNDRIPELTNIVMNYAKSHGNPVLGMEALKVYLRYHGIKVPAKYTFATNMSQVDLLTMDLDHTTSSLYNIISGMLDINEKVTVKQHSPLNKSEFLPAHAIISLVSNKTTRHICTVYNVQACYSYKVIDGYNILTIDSFLSMMYASLFTRREYYDVEKIKCMINILLNIQAQHLKSKKYIWKRFDILCYGNQPRIEDVKKMRWQAKKNFQIYRPSQKNKKQQSVKLISK